MSYQIRPLLPGPLDVVRQTIIDLDNSVESVLKLAEWVEHKLFIVQGLRVDQTRILQRELTNSGGYSWTNIDGNTAVIAGSLACLSALPPRLVAFGVAAKELAEALAQAVVASGSSPVFWAMGDLRLSLSQSTLLMGIINATPDSFSGDGVGTDLSRGLKLAEQMVSEGVDIIDVGGESTRPGHEAVSVDEELARVVPLVEDLASHLSVPISIDTRKAVVAEAAIKAGASIVNDVWGLRRDPAMAQVVAEHSVGLVVMHNRSQPTTLEDGDLMAGIFTDLSQSLSLVERAGIAQERVVLDPGFGFGKTPAQNVELIRRLGELRSLGRPLLFGASRKSTVGWLLGGAPVEQRLEGSLALAVLAVQAGANILRVHDVAATRRALTVAEALLRAPSAELLAAPLPGQTG